MFSRADTQYSSCEKYYTYAHRRPAPVKKYIHVLLLIETMNHAGEKAWSRGSGRRWSSPSVVGKGSMRPGEPTALARAAELAYGHSDIGDEEIVVVSIEAKWRLLTR
jgi:hypothetical protein